MRFYAGPIEILTAIGHENGHSALFFTVRITAVLVGAAAIGWAFAATGLGPRLHQPRAADGAPTDAEPLEAQTPIGWPGRALHNARHGYS